MSTLAATHTYKHRFRTMGCPAEICVYATHGAAAKTGIDLAAAECQRLDRKYSHYRDDSYLTALQREAARPQGALVDAETAALLDLASTLHKESQGRFDISAGRLTALWERRTTLPRPDEIATALALTGWHRARWDGVHLRLPRGLRFDLGGLVKEYAVDRATLLLKASGLVSGYIDLGGDLHVLGPHPDGRPWLIGLRNPRGPGAMASIRMLSGGLATSGDYARCTFIDGQRYSHIVDPGSGWPTRGLATVSVVAPSCLLAGAMSTLAMLMEAGAALEFLSRSGLAWLAHDGAVSCSDQEFAERRVEAPPYPSPNRPRRWPYSASTRLGAA